MCAQSKPLSDAQADLNSGDRPEKDCRHWDEYNMRYLERNMELPSPTLKCCNPTATVFLSFLGGEDPT